MLGPVRDTCAAACRRQVLAQPSRLIGPVVRIPAVEGDERVETQRHLALSKQQRNEPALAAVAGELLAETRPAIGHVRRRQHHDREPAVLYTLLDRGGHWHPERQLAGQE